MLASETLFWTIMIAATAILIGFGYRYGARKQPKLLAYVTSGLVAGVVAHAMILAIYESIGLAEYFGVLGDPKLAGMCQPILSPNYDCPPTERATDIAIVIGGGLLAIVPLLTIVFALSALISAQRKA